MSRALLGYKDQNCIGPCWSLPTRTLTKLEIQPEG